MSRSDASLQALTISFPNLAGVGLPLVHSVLGPTGTIPLAVALAAGSILISPLSLIIVEMSTGKADGGTMSAMQIVRAVRRALTKPVVLAPALGILLSLSNLKLDPLADACLALIASAAGGVALFLTGLILSAQAFRLDWKVVAATAASDVVRPLLAAAVVWFVPISVEAAKTAILLAAVPSGFFGILFAVNYKLDSATAGSMVTASTVVSIATMAIAIAVLFPPLGLTMALAILCSGQGRQHPDMFALTADAPEAAGAFAHAAALLGHDPRDFVRGQSGEVLHRNRAGQILCTVQALAAAAALRGAMPRRLVVAGYSVGEVAAWGVAGLFNATDTLDLVARRAEAMDAATEPGDGLMFVRGLSRENIDRLCERHHAAVAIVNPGDAFVLGGGRDALQAIADEAKAMRATRVVELPVEVASHTSRLAAASRAFRESLRLSSPMFPAARRHPHPERHRWRPGHRYRGRPGQAGGADIANGAMGELSAGLHRGRRHRLPRTGAGACAERNGGGRLARHSGAIAGRFQDASGGARLACASRRRLEHDPEECGAVFRNDHAQTGTESAMTIHPDQIAQPRDGWPVSASSRQRMISPPLAGLPR